MSEDFFANIPREGEDDEIEFSLEEETETPAESQPETTNEEEEPSQEGDNIPDESPQEENIPFHKHPRFQEVIQEKNTLKEQLEDQRKRFEELESSFDKKIDSLQSPTQQQLDPNLVTLLGENPDHHRAWKNSLQAQKDAWMKEVRESIAKEQQEQQAETARWNKWVEDSISGLESEGKKFDRNKLMDVAVKYRPTDDQGNIDFSKAYELYEQLTPKDTAKSKARKKAASLSDATNVGGSTGKKIITSQDVRNRSW